MVVLNVIGSNEQPRLFLVRCCALAYLPGVRLPLHVTAGAEQKEELGAVLGGMDLAFSAIKVTMKSNLHKIDKWV